MGAKNYPGLKILAHARSPSKLFNAHTPFGVRRMGLFSWSCSSGTEVSRSRPGTPYEAIRFSLFLAVSFCGLSVRLTMPPLLDQQDEPASRNS